MTHWFRGTALATCVISAAGLATTVTRGAPANQDPPSQETIGAEPTDAADHTGGLLQEALKLPSLTAAQRTQVQQALTRRRTASAPVRQANSHLLSELAQQVDKSSVDEAKLQPQVKAVDDAASAAMPTYMDTVNQLHSLLTPAQRNELVDQVEAQVAQRKAARGSSSADAGARAQGQGQQGEPDLWTKLDLTDQQKSQVRAAMQADRPDGGGGAAREEGAAAQDHRAMGRAFLDAFRGDPFDAHSFNLQPHPGEHEERLAQALLPVLSPAQKTTFADFLRQKAART